LSTDPLSHAGLCVATVFVVRYILLQLFGRFVATGNRSAGQSIRSIVGRRNIDYRLVIVGSLLPDLIDKSLQFWFISETFDFTGRSIAHTLVFNFILIALSLLVLPVNRALGPLIFSLSSIGHLVFDRMWESPTTLFWPLYGLSYGGVEHKLSPSWLDWTQTGTGPFILDCIGALVLLIFALVLFRRRTVLQWIRTGVG